MSLVTYDVLPPPETVQIEMGEMRHAGRAPIHLAIGPELTMEKFPGSTRRTEKSGAKPAPTISGTKSIAAT